MTEETRQKMIAEIRRLHACERQARIECEEWKDRYEAERDDHLATLDMKIESRQGKLAANAEATERWQRKLFRAANELQKLAAQRKRLPL